MSVPRATIAIVGNPNSGKSTVFNGLTGRDQKVGNWPGVTWGVRLLLVLCAALLALGLAASPAVADTQTWNDVVDEMAAVLDRADETYRAGDPEGAKDLVNEAYYGYYERLGFEKTVMAYLSGDRAVSVEYKFSQIKKDMLAGAPADQVSADLTTLVGMLREDANQLDGEQGQSPYALLLGSLVIILREGFEAILVVGAIVAYLVKSGNQDKTKFAYTGAGLALLASAGLAWLFNALTVASGASQEIVEGATMLLAVAMLVWVSNWILAKSEADAWTAYIKDRSEASLSRGSMFSLAFVAFLAVLREGAETILFYQALLAQTSENHHLVWLGMAIGAVALVAVYLAVRFLSIRIPLRPFFLGTSVLLAVMAFIFTGGGIKELQEGGVVSATVVPGMTSVDLLGIYPTVETLAAQVLVLALIVALSVAGVRKARATGRAARASDLSGPATGASPAATPSSPSSNAS